MTDDKLPPRVTLTKVEADTVLYLSQAMLVGLTEGLRLDKVLKKTATRGDMLVSCMFLYYLALTDQVIPESHEEVAALMVRARDFIEPMTKQAALLILPVEGRVQ